MLLNSHVFEKNVVLAADSHHALGEAALTSKIEHPGFRVVYQHRSLTWLLLTHQYIQRGCLSSPVVAEEAENLISVQIQVEIVNSCEISEFLGHRLKLH